MTLLKRDRSTSACPIKCFTLAMCLLNGGFLFSSSQAEDPKEQQDVVQAKKDYEVDKEALERVTTDIRILASEEFGGRQPGKPGIQLAEDYLVKHYTEIGLKPLANGTYLQEFEVGRQLKLDPESARLVLHGPADTKLEFELGKDWAALNSRSNPEIKGADLVFVGFGLAASELNFDEYANVDVKDKVVVLIRTEPQGKSEQSVFHRDTPTRHASIRTKVTAARRAGAVAVILVNDTQTAPDEAHDDLVSSDLLGSMVIPFAQIKRSKFEALLETTAILGGGGEAFHTLTHIEDHIDDQLEPISQPVVGWTVDYEAKFISSGIKTNNVIGVLEGEGPLANETIVIGAHYDHLGDGAYGSRAPGRREIHYGADDNATGTAAVVELARRFAKRDKKPERRMVFICFSAEEMGLLGAVHYVANPEFPLEDTAMMINFDMIGWLREKNVHVLSWNSSAQFEPVLDRCGEELGLEVVKPRSSIGGSDHMPFNSRQIPNLFFHTGLHEVYHTPEDNFESINCEGAVHVIDFSEKVIEQMMAIEKRPVFGPPRPFQLGITLAENPDEARIETVTSDSVAEKAGLLVDDLILKINDEEVTSGRVLRRILRSEEGKTVQFRIKRGDKERVLDISLVNPAEE